MQQVISKIKLTYAWLIHIKITTSLAILFNAQCLLPAVMNFWIRNEISALITISFEIKTDAECSESNLHRSQ
jgi:hypothetical protein